MGGWAFGSLRPLSYDLIVIDPPWAYETYSERGQQKGAATQYTTLSCEDIAAMFPVDQLAAGNCLLMCWGTQPLLDRQLAAVKRWRFKYQSMVMWEKVFPSGKPAIGTGYRVRSMCEPIIIATIGEPRHKPFPGLFKGVRREHSRKPERFYELIDEKCPKLFRRADVFGRQTRPGYDVFGNEATKFDEEAA